MCTGTPTIQISRQNTRLNLPPWCCRHGAPKRDFTYVDDVVSGVVAALALGADEELFNLGNHRTETLLHFIEV